jgi:hypothetical protein
LSRSDRNRPAAIGPQPAEKNRTLIFSPSFPRAERLSLGLFTKASERMTFYELVNASERKILENFVDLDEITWY